MKKLNLCPMVFVLLLTAVWVMQPVGTALAGELTLTFASTTPPPTISLQLS